MDVCMSVCIYINIYIYIYIYMLYVDTVEQLQMYIILYHISYYIILYYLYYIILHYIISLLYYIILYYIILYYLYYIILHYIISYYIILYYLYYIILYYIMLYHIISCYIILYYFMHLLYIVVHISCIICINIWWYMYVCVCAGFQPHLESLVLDSDRSVRAQGLDFPRALGTAGWCWTTGKYWKPHLRNPEDPFLSCCPSFGTKKNIGLMICRCSYQMQWIHITNHISEETPRILLSILLRFVGTDSTWDQLHPSRFEGGNQIVHE